MFAWRTLQALAHAQHCQKQLLHLGPGQQISAQQLQGISGAHLHLLAWSFLMEADAHLGSALHSGRLPGLDPIYGPAPSDQVADSLQAAEAVCAAALGLLPATDVLVVVRIIR